MDEDASIKHFKIRNAGQWTCDIFWKFLFWSSPKVFKNSLQCHVELKMIFNCFYDRIRHIEQKKHNGKKLKGLKKD